MSPFELWATTPNELASMLRGADARRTTDRDNEDARFAQLSYLIYALNTDKKHRKLKPKDFTPKYQESPKTPDDCKKPTMSGDKMMQVASILNQSMGGDTT